jgi:hypothetical protein
MACARSACSPPPVFRFKSGLHVRAPLQENVHLKGVVWKELKYIMLIAVDTGHMTTVHMVSGCEYTSTRLTVPGSMWLHVLQCLKSAFCVSFLPHSNSGVENEDQQDDGRFYERTKALVLTVLLKQRQSQRHCCCQKQNFDKCIIELGQEQLPQGCALLVRKFIWAVLLLSQCHFVL